VALLSPVLLVVAILVRLRLGTPVLFRQKRPGRHGVPFEMLKFRTMTDARGPDGELLSDTERLTPFGRWLRKTSLDELPELFNVIRGDMSLVGPRPLLMRYYPWFTDEERARFDVRPGITGLAQISGRNDLAWDQRIATDVEYVRRQSLVFDLSIIFKTLERIVSKKGLQEDPGAVMLDFDEERRRRAIRRARPEDAARVYEVLQEAFGATYLRWTIYQSPKSVAYLRSLIEGSNHEIFLSDDGFYDAVRTPDALFLNYIGSVRKGGGNALLDHFESRARELGLATALDVFASNDVARTWYERRGYARVSSMWQVMVPMAAIDRGTPLTCDALPLAEERERGFTKVACGEVEVGLINGDTARLLRAGDPYDAASRVAATFDRKWLIVPGLQERPTRWPDARVEELIRMRKELASR